MRALAECVKQSALEVAVSRDLTPKPERDLLRSIRQIGDDLTRRTSQEAARQQTVLQQRVQQRLDDLHLKARTASVEANLGPDAVRTILSGRSRSPRAENLAALARVLQCDVGYLLGTQDEPFAITEPHERPDETFVGVAPLTMDGFRRLRYGWVDIVEGEQAFEGYATALLTLPQYLPGYQHLELLEDEHFDRHFPAGALLHTLSPTDMDRPALRDGDIVILARQRLNPEDEKRGQIERTVRRAVQTAPSVLMLETASTHARMQDAVMWDGPDIQASDQPGSLRLYRPRHEALMIDGFVLRAHLHVSGPPILGERFTDPDELTQWVKHSARKG